MNWIKKIFKSGKLDQRQNVSREEEMLVKLDASIIQCNQEIKKAMEETDQIKKWAEEAILEVLQVPNKLWYHEIEKYEEIKQLDENKNVDPKVIYKCDEVISEYKEQIKLREAKIVLYNTLIQNYTTTKDKMLQIKKRADDEKLTQTKLQILEKHTQRIDQLKNNPENMNDHIVDTNYLEQITSEAREVIDEFEISEEVKAELEKINHEVKTGKYSLSAKPAIDEIEKLAEKIKKLE